MDKSVALAVLGGGQGKRIGKKKSRLRIDSRSLLEIISERIGFLFQEKYYISKASEDEFILPLGFERLNDVYDYQTPLVGVYTALFYANSHRVLAVGCDMPFIKPQLVKLLLERSSLGDVVVPCSSKGPEPLMAIYSKCCLQPIRESLESGEKRLISFFESVKVYYLKAEEISKVDLEEISFFNINTREDLEKAREMIKTDV